MSEKTNGEIALAPVAKQRVHKLDVEAAATRLLSLGLHLPLFLDSNFVAAYAPLGEGPGFANEPHLAKG